MRTCRRCGVVSLTCLSELYCVDSQIPMAMEKDRVDSDDFFIDSLKKLVGNVNRDTGWHAVYFAFFLACRCDGPLMNSRRAHLCHCFSVSSIFVLLSPLGSLLLPRMVHGFPPHCINLRRFSKENSGELIERLRKVVEIPSISARLERRESCLHMAEILKEMVIEFGGTAHLAEIGFQQVDGQKHELPKGKRSIVHLSAHRSHDPTSTQISTLFPNSFPPAFPLVAVLAQFGDNDPQKPTLLVYGY